MPLEKVYIHKYVYIYIYLSFKTKRGGGKTAELTYHTENLSIYTKARL